RAPALLAGECRTWASLPAAHERGAERARRTAARHGKNPRQEARDRAARARRSRAVARRRARGGGRMTPRELEGRWTSRLVLKRDVFSTVERGRFATPAGEVEAVLRRIDQVPSS